MLHCPKYFIKIIYIMASTLITILRLCYSSEVGRLCISREQRGGHSGGRAHVAQSREGGRNAQGVSQEIKEPACPGLEGL